MQIRAVDARYGGCSHDSLVWSLSDLRRHLEDERSSSSDQNNWILGERSFYIFVTIIQMKQFQVILAIPVNRGLSRHIATL